MSDQVCFSYCGVSASYLSEKWEIHLLYKIWLSSNQFDCSEFISIQSAASFVCSCLLFWMTSTKIHKIIDWWRNLEEDMSNNILSTVSDDVFKLLGCKDNCRKSNSQVEIQYIYMGWIINVQLSCYLVLLSSKTRQQDIYTSLTEPKCKWYLEG